MDEYPEELRTPPVGLVSMVGCPEMHSMISTHLHSQQPPINTLALPDFSKLSLIAPKERDVDAVSPHPAGILKSGWLIKHRTRVPAVVAALFSRDDVYGDPSQWLQVCANLDNLKTVIRGRNIRLLVVIVYSTHTDDGSEDRLLALRKRAELDTKCFVIFSRSDASELNRSLSRLASVFAELSNIYYREEGRRIKLRIEKKNFTSIELNVRYNFKVAVFAEFRRDWVEALKFYENAYAVLREMINTPAELQPIQRLVEIKVVAEQLLFKVSTLLMHGGKGIEAIKWFRQHIGWYKHLKGRQEAAFLHWEWICRQYNVFAELLKASASGSAYLSPPVLSSSGPPVMELEQQPGYYYELAAYSMRERRSSFKLAVEILKSSGNVNVEDFQMPTTDLSAPLYVGQYPQILDNSDGAHRRSPTEEEYLGHFIAEEKSFRHSHFIIDAFTKAYEEYKLFKASRMCYHVASEMGREYFIAEEYANAKRLFESVASLYRQEVWVSLLWTSLGYLRECAKCLGLLQDYVEYSLEMATLPVFPTVQCFSMIRESKDSPVGPCSHNERIKIQNELCGILKGTTSMVLPDNDSKGFAATDSQPISVEIDVVSPLRGVLLAYVAFHDTAVKPGRVSMFTLALLTHLAQPLRVEKLEIQFNQSQCNFFVKAENKHGLDDVDSSENIRFETVEDLELIPSKWRRLTFSVNAGMSGKLECLSVVAHIGPHSTVCCRAESPASREDLQLWRFEDKFEPLPMSDGNLSFIGQKFIQVEDPDPLVDVELRAFKPGLVGEAFPVTLIVKSRGHTVHDGVLKINVVESKLGPSASFREASAASTGSLDVEILATSENEPRLDGTPADNGTAKRCSSLLKLPVLECGMSWSGNLFIRWSKPKAVTLFVSLGYHTVTQNGKEEAQQKLHIHKSLQLEGQNAFTLSHKYMTPFRRHSLFQTHDKKASAPDSPVTLPINENNVLMVTAKNSSEVPIRIMSVNIEEESSKSCSINRAKAVYSRSDSDSVADSERKLANGIEGAITSYPLLMPNGVYTQIFSVCPTVVSPTLCVGKICIKWKRDTKALQADTDDHNTVSYLEEDGNTLDLSTVTIREDLSTINVEKPLVVVSLDCPSHALLGVPFFFHVKIQNETWHLQEIKFSVHDTQSFLLSGAHSDTISILPNSVHLLSYKLIPLASGPQQLPQVILTAVRYAAGFNPFPMTTQLFVFPSDPYLKLDNSKSQDSVVIV